MGWGQLPGADGAAQDARPHVRPLRQLQRRRGGRLPRARRAAARLGPAVRQLVARGRPQGVLRAAAGRPGAAPHLPGRLGGEAAEVTAHAQLCVVCA